MTGRRNGRRIRTDSGLARPHRIGPLRLSDLELAALTLAASRRGLSVGAYTIETALSVAHETLTPLPVGLREQARAFMEARAEIRAVCDRMERLLDEGELGGRDAVRQQMLKDARRAVLSLEEACSAIVAEHRVPRLETRHRRQRAAAAAQVPAAQKDEEDEEFEGWFEP
ncbi:hypothetical protein ACFQ08_24735 [Streptosporangium algeriense]|uniref:Mobilization protein n=1 Tax=Streptosporangium algeriense TaxID=1682748 RepID=A0ABW3DV91_9ACTN